MADNDEIADGGFCCLCGDPLDFDNALEADTGTCSACAEVAEEDDEG